MEEISMYATESKTMSLPQLIELLCAPGWSETRTYVEGDFNVRGEPPLVYTRRVLTRDGIEIQQFIPRVVDLDKKEASNHALSLDDPRTNDWSIVRGLQIVAAAGEAPQDVDENDVLAQAIEICLKQRASDARHLFEYDTEEVFSANWEQPPQWGDGFFGER